MPYTFEEVIQNEMIKEHRRRPQPRYPVWLEGLKVFLMFMGAACMISYAAFNARGYTTVLYSIPFYVQPWLTTYVRRKWNSVIKDMIVAVVFIVCLLFAPTLSTGFVALGYVIMLTGYQLIREFSYEPEREMGICIMIINGAFFLFAGLLIILHRQWEFEVLLNLLTVVYALLFLKYRHYLTVEDLIGTQKKAGEKINFSEHRIKHYNNRILWAFCGVVVLFVIIANGLGADKALAKVFDDIFIRVEENLHGAWLSNRPTNIGATMEGGREWLVTSDEFTLAKLCGYIIRWILSYWYVLAAVVFALYLIKEDYMRRKEKRKYERLEYTETTEFYKGTAQKRRHRSLAQLLDRSEENLVRRAYYKRIKGEMGKTVERSDTPKQVGDKLPDAKELTKRYNEIRYKGEKIK